MDEEAPIDPRTCQPVLQEFTDRDFEGHRAHTVYVGLHGANNPARRHSRRSKHGFKSADGSILSEEINRPRSNSTTILTRRRQSVSTE
uniref:Uncharacterized protein n=1 Tax=Megaselia scalaris TaxID=36166 RepID=T1GYZ3_MEGSC